MQGKKTKRNKDLLLEEIDIPTHVVAVFAFIEKNGKYLLAKRSADDPQAPGVWSVPGGKVDLDEGSGIIKKTVKKEIMEEIGLEVEDRMHLIWDEGFYRVSGHHVVGLTFLCKWKKGMAKPLEDQEQVKWFSKKELRNFTELPDYFRPRVNKLLQVSW